jgi:hypothetical protein
MVSASLWAEPFLVSVTVAQQDVTGGEKYFWKRSTLVSALDGMVHAAALCVDGGDGWVCDVEVLKSGCGGARLASRHCKLETRGLGEDAATKRIGPYSAGIQWEHAQSTVPSWLRCLAPGVDCSSPHMSPMM